MLMKLNGVFFQTQCAVDFLLGKQSLMKSTAGDKPIKTILYTICKLNALCFGQIYSFSKTKFLLHYWLQVLMGSLLSFYCQFFATQNIGSAKELVALL